jgi:hypothetical protein
MLIIYGRMLWLLLRRDTVQDPLMRGLALGALGGLTGFVISGLVHYNFGDSEVVMIFYFIMGLTLTIKRLSRAQSDYPSSRGAKC